MKRPHTRLLLQVLVGVFALATLTLWILYQIERYRVIDRAEADLAARRDAVKERIEAFVLAEGRRLLSIDLNRSGLPEDVNIVGGRTLLLGGWQVGDRNLFTTVLEEDEARILVTVKREEVTYLRSEVPLAPVLDALAEVCPRRRGHVHLTMVNGRSVLRWPPPKEPGAEMQKYRRSSHAFDAVADGKTGEEIYKDLDDKDAVGAYGASEIFHGGIVVEQDARVALAAIRGFQPWQASAGLRGLAIFALVVRLVLPRIRFTGDLVRLYTHAKRYWWVVAAAILAMSAYAGANMFRLTLLKTVFDDVLMGRGSGAMEALRWVLYWFGVTIVVMAVAEWVKEYLTAYVTQRMVNDIRCEVSAHLIRLDVAYFDRQKAGELMSRLSNDVNETRKSLGLIFGEFFQEPLMLVGALGAAFITNWRLTLMVFIGIPMLIYPVYKLGRLVKKYSKRRQVQAAVVTEVMMQSVSGVRIVKGFQREDHEDEKLRRTSNRLLTQAVKVARTNAFSRTIVDLMNSIGGLLILAVGGYMVIYGIAGVTAGDLATLSVIMARMYKPVKVLTKTYNKIQESLAGADRIFEIIDEVPEIAEDQAGEPLERPEREIAFERVSFAYGDKPVLRDISFTVRVGETVGLVGETGAGKSTVTDLVARFYDPDEGRVAVDGKDLRDYRVRDVRAAVGVVTQDAFLFNASVRDNILYGLPSATREEVEEAARIAGIHEEIVAMEDGYDTLVGERGARLSGGQRQRITIARGILKNAPILILDEATSALDSQTESAVQAALDRMAGERTTFVIAHRLSTIASADRVLVFKEGELVEQGTHEELMAREGVYHSLHLIQFAGGNGQKTGGEQG